MHVTTTTIWESEMHRQDLLAIARQQKSAPSRGKEREVLTVRIAARHARALITSLVAIAIGLSTNQRQQRESRRGATFPAAVGVPQRVQSRQG